jgi:hypothetical protein
MRSVTDDVNIELLKNVGKEIISKLPDAEYFRSSTPSICMGSDNTLGLNLRYVDYKIKDDGNYENREHITTHNIISMFDISSPVWKKKNEHLLEYDHSMDNVYVGLEDVRLFYHHKEWKFNANRGLGWGNMLVEHGIINNHRVTSEKLLKIEGQQGIEKNWVMFQDIQKKLKMIYGWHPLVIGEVNPENEQFIVGQKIASPPFFKSLRGSTNGVKIGNEIWFICHAVSYEDRRYYYHIFVVLDASTYSVKKYSPFFTFTKEKVEYTLGFVYMEKTGEFLIGYSVLDRTTDFMYIRKKTIEDTLIS